MKSVLIFAIILAVAGGGTYITHYHDLPMMIFIGSWEIETSASVIVIGLSILVAILWAVTRLFVGVCLLPSCFSNVYARRQQRIGTARLFETLNQLASNRLEEADRSISEARNRLNSDRFSLALSAWTARLRGEDQKARSFFIDLKRMNRDNDVSVSKNALANRGLIELAITRKEHETALALTKSALKNDPDNLWLLEKLFQFYTTDKRWEQALHTLDHLHRLKKNRQRAPIHRHRALCEVMLGREKMTMDRLSEARRWYRQALKHDPECTEAYLALGDAAKESGKPEKAVDYWREGLTHKSNPEIFDRLARHFSSHPLKLVPILEELFEKKEDLPEDDSLLPAALIRACLASKMWGRARELLLHIAAREKLNETFSLLHVQLEIQESLKDVQSEIVRDRLNSALAFLKNRQH